MYSETATIVKKFLNRVILIGVIGMAIAFLLALNSSRKYLVVGKLVVFPSGLATAQQNLGYEVGNTVQIINSSAFKTGTFQGSTGNFAYAKQLGNSSTVAVAFYADNNEQALAEDSIVRVPTALADYTRDLYGGSPFSYKLLSDPEISTRPVKPNLAEYLTWGFIVGALVYLLYWFLFEFLRIPMERKRIMLVEPKKENSTIISPEIKTPKPSEPATSVDRKKIGGGKVEIVDGRPHFVPGKKESAPENLPFIDETISDVPSDIQEPSDEEVKDRLNRLMRGEL